MTVRTDNLFIAHYQGSLLEEFHYYPFGMCFEVSKSPTLGKSAAIKYNSQLHEHDEFEDANGNVYGLEDYNFAFRNYDAQLGRWLQPDPLMQHPSPYLAMSNNPVSFTDPSGLFDGTVINNWGDIVYQAGSHTNGYYIMDYSFGFGLSLDGDKSIKSGHYYVTEISAYEFYSRNHERRFLMNQFGNRFNVTMDAGGNYRPMGEAYGEAAARFQENLINGVNAYNSGSAGDLLKGAQSGGGDNSSATFWNNVNTGIGAFDVGQGAKGELISFAAKSSPAINDLKYVKTFSRLGKVSFGASTLISGGLATNYYMNGGTNSSVGIKAGIDIIMGGVGFLGPIGFGVSATYFLLDAGGAFGGYGDPLLTTKK